MASTLKKTPLVWIAVWLLAMAVGTMALVATAQTARAGEGPSVTPTVKSGNPTCKTLLGDAAAFEVKIDPPKSGTYGPITVTFHDNGTQVDFSSTVAVDAVFVKGGNQGGNLYDYSSAPSTGDNNLTTPTGPNGQPQGISHVSFCWNEEPPPTPKALKVSKTADATYDHKIDWKLEKSVDDNSHTGTAGQTAGTSKWTVKATKTATDSNFEVTGEITITNPNDKAVEFDVYDTLDDGTAAVVDCNTSTEDVKEAYGTVPANDTVKCPYTALPTTRDAKQNNVLVDSKTEGVPGSTALAPFGWKANVTGVDEATMADEHLGYSQLIKDSTTFEKNETFDCPSDVDKYENGKFSYTVPNTATLKNLPSLDQSSKAEVKVDCTLPALTASKTADGTYDRKVDWKLEKSVDDNSHTGTAGKPAGTSNWTVKATKTATDSNFEVTGEITITNPAAVDQEFTVTDKLNDVAGTVASVDCNSDLFDDQDSAIIPAKSTYVCTYTALPDSSEATLNTATVTATGNSPVKAEKAFSFVANVTGDETVELADARFGYNKDIDSTTTFTEPETFTCPSDPNLYKDGKHSYSVKNTATLTGTPPLNLTADATVDVDCTLPALTATKTAKGTYDRNITWDLKKSVNPASHSGLAGDSFTSTWKVDATKTVVENNYKVTGNIVVTNPSAIAQTFNVTDKLDDPAGTAAEVDCDPVAGGSQVSAKVDPGKSVTCKYTASAQGATLNTATVSAPGNNDSTATAAVSYSPIVKGYEQLTLSDPRLGYSQVISDTTSFSKNETFKCSSDPTKYTNYSRTDNYQNIATLGTGATTLYSAKADVTVTCKYPWRGETATGAGTRYPGTSNWFMYTAYQTTKVDLIAGQYYDAGDIYMTRSGGNTYIKVTLASGFRFANVAQNLKIQDFAKAPAKYVQPGNFKYKFSVAQGTNTYTAKIPGDTAKFYGIHADVERYVP
jgi:uncharacterized cupin superfamily protein